MLRVRLDDLYALTGDRLLPVVALCQWEELLKHGELVCRGLQHLADEILGQRDIVACHRQHRQDVAWFDRPEQVSERAVLEEFGRESGIWPEQQRLLAADNAGVEVRDRHRWRSFRRLAVDLGVVTVADRAHVATQPDAADREAAIAVTFGNARLLQQRQRTAAGTNEDEFGRDCVFSAVLAMLDLAAQVTF